MCGIVGNINLKNKNTDSLFLRNAVNQLSKRGPDNKSTIITKNGGLGHTRLSIIDTTNGANQPMEIGRYVIVFNGEIYNYQSIKKNLETKGVDFVTSSDTEVLLRLFIEKGEEALNELDGFFSFCILQKI